MAENISTQISAFASRVGTECKNLHAEIGDLSTLKTTAKTSAVVAVNEVKDLVAANVDSLNGHATRLTAVEGKAAANETAIAGVTTRVTAAEDKIAANESAIAALEGVVASSTNIDDVNVSTATTYSSSKITSEITAAKAAVKADLLGGAGEAYDTLKELADLIQNNEDAIDALEALAAGHVKYDGAQTITLEQQAQARANIGAAAATDLTTANGKIGEVETKAAATATELAALKEAVGDTTVDFAAAFEAALA